jgi:RimJ/RimL family protein N-acetyltransferase
LNGPIIAIQQLSLYRLDAPTLLESDPRCRRLEPEDESIVAVFFARHYASTIFSSWMLAQHFYGLFEQNELRACGGVVVSSRKIGSANLGNFLTSPDHRGRGLAGAVASTLIHALEADGLHTFVLGTTEENLPARRTYERLGFHLVETRPQVDLCAPAF